jgi:CRP-like cAMP-binding protein
VNTIRNFPSGNHLLAALPAIEWARFQPHIERVALERGAVLHEAGMPLIHVYFPESGVVSLVSSMEDGASAELAVVGNEGMVGICAIMGGGIAHSSAVVQGEGHGLRMPASEIAALSRHSPAIMQPLLRYTQTLFLHMSQTCACNRHHSSCAAGCCSTLTGTRTTSCSSPRSASPGCSGYAVRA